jgi:hypothetical protein
VKQALHRRILRQFQCVRRSYNFIYALHNGLTGVCPMLFLQVTVPAVPNVNTTLAAYNSEQTPVEHQRLYDFVNNQLRPIPPVHSHLGGNISSSVFLINKKKSEQELLSVCRQN